MTTPPYGPPPNPKMQPRLCAEEKDTPMGIADFFRSRWKHSNPDVRLEAVKALADQAVLTDMAQNDKHERVRLVASAACLILISVILTTCKVETFTFSQSEAKIAWATCDSMSARTAAAHSSASQWQGNLYVVARYDRHPATFVQRWYGDGDYSVRLSDASAVLCVAITERVVEECKYQDSNRPSGLATVPRVMVDAKVTLLSWPSRELITQDTLYGPTPPRCTPVCDACSFRGEPEIVGWLQRFRGEPRKKGWLQQFHWKSLF
jgi:hypothetical protein